MNFTDFPFCVRTLGILCFSLALGWSFPHEAWSQDENELPEPRDVQLETSDGVVLFAVYYPGTAEKENVPVILLHAWEADHRAMVSMASTLQSRFGCAAIVPDLRGHGKSNKTNLGVELDRDRWRGSEVAAVIEDIEACKKFLIQENNTGQLNIDLLTVVADGESTILACTWTLRDWSYAPLGSVKQGQDVKALILMNPVRNFKGLNGNHAFQGDLFTGRLGAAFPVMIACEQDHLRDAKNIYERMMKGRKSFEDSEKSLPKYRFEIEAQRRVRKSRDGDVPMDEVVGAFIEEQVFARREDFRWAERGTK